MKWSTAHSRAWGGASGRSERSFEGARRARWAGALLVTFALAGCGGSASETPFPMEPVPPRPLQGTKTVGRGPDAADAAEERVSRGEDAAGQPNRAEGPGAELLPEDAPKSPDDAPPTWGAAPR